MSRDRYIIVRIQHATVPSIVSYVGHGQTPYDLTLRFAHFRDSATQYSTKREAICEAKRLAGIFPGQFKVVCYWGRTTAYDSLSA